MYDYKYVKMYLHEILAGVGFMTDVLQMDIGCVKSKVIFTERNIKHWII